MIPTLIWRGHCGNYRGGGRIGTEFAESREILKTMLGGVVEYDETSGRWYFIKGRHKFPIGVTAEGIKKIAILESLVVNRYLNNGSIVFIDEPESALHPTAISQLLDIVELLSNRGIQFVLASHSYFVVEKLSLIALEKGCSIPVLSADDNGWQRSDLLEGMPDNPIINESIRFYKEGVKQVLT